MRLDSQGMMKKGEDKMKWYNLQVQVKRAAPGTVVRVECPVKDPWTAQQIRDGLKASVTGMCLPRPRNG
jgi:hypothetical protein